MPKNLVRGWYVVSKEGKWQRVPDLWTKAGDRVTPTLHSTHARMVWIDV